MSSLVSTKTSRIVHSAAGRGVMEFGLRRSNDLGGVHSSYASYIGGAIATSNVNAGRIFNIPVGGTHSHAFVMSFGIGNEKLAFKEYLKANPKNSVVLIDTYDTIKGVENLIDVCKELGIVPAGVRIDSGDLSYLSKEVRTILDNAGYEKTKIYVSGDLDEYVIDSLVCSQKSKIDAFGVGTRLVTDAYNNSLGCVYKLKEISGEPVIKVSSSQSKVTIPYKTNVIRLQKDGGEYLSDIVVKSSFDGVKDGMLASDISSINPETSEVKVFKAGSKCYMVHKNLMRLGKISETVEKELLNINLVRARGLDSMSKISEYHKRIHNPHIYIAGVESSLMDDMLRLVAASRI